MHLLQKPFKQAVVLCTLVTVKIVTCTNYLQNWTTELNTLQLLHNCWMLGRRYQAQGSLRSESRNIGGNDTHPERVGAHLILTLFKGGKGPMQFKPMLLSKSGSQKLRDLICFLHIKSKFLGWHSRPSAEMYLSARCSSLSTPHHANTDPATRDIISVWITP